MYTWSRPSESYNCNHRRPANVLTPSQRQSIKEQDTKDSWCADHLLRQGQICRGETTGCAHITCFEASTKEMLKSFFKRGRLGSLVIWHTNLVCVVGMVEFRPRKAWQTEFRLGKQYLDIFRAAECSSAGIVNTVSTFHHIA